MPATTVSTAAMVALTVRTKRDGCHRRDAWRQHVPDEHVLDREDRIRCGGDAARQRAGQAIGEIARRMTGQMAEQVAPQIAGDAHEREARDPAGEPPQQIVGGDQGNQKEKREPDALRGGGPAASVSTRYFTPYCVVTEQPTAASTAATMTAWPRPQPDIAKDEREWPIGVAAGVVHRSSAFCRP